MAANIRKIMALPLIAAGVVVLMMWSDYIANCSYITPSCEKMLLWGSAGTFCYFALVIVFTEWYASFYENVRNTDISSNYQI